MVSGMSAAFVLSPCEGTGFVGGLSFLGMGFCGLREVAWRLNFATIGAGPAFRISAILASNTSEESLLPVI